MAKVSIGLRGWRFEESEVFDEAGRFRPLSEMPQDTADRLSRLSALAATPCDACYLLFGEAEIAKCNVAEVVYGEPMAEVTLCADHERDFLYWFREAGGDEFRGDTGMRDAFHEWFDDGGRAPEDYAGIEHVETDPENLPDPPDPNELDAAACDVDLDVEYPKG